MAAAHGGKELMTGLRNLGNTCFMNSVLQCLSNTVPLAKYFVQKRYLRDINRSNPLGTKGELAEEFGELVSSLWLRKYRHFSPAMFKNSIAKFAPQFQGSQQQDSQEFCSYLLDGLHEDLNRVALKQYVQHPDLDNMPTVDAGKLSWKLSKKRDDSQICDLFQGQYKSSIKCRSCGHTSLSFTPFTFLTLPLPKRGQRTTLKDCINNFSETELVTGADAWHCPHCKCPRDALKTITIWRLPAVLIIQLKRFYFEGVFRSKLQNHVNFPVDGLLMEDASSGRPQDFKYDLYGVVNHYGDLSGGHYISFGKHPFSGKWITYDDSVVNEMPQSKVCSSAAYMLFYSRVRFDNELF